MSAAAVQAVEFLMQLLDGTLSAWFLCRLNGVRPRAVHICVYLVLSLGLGCIFIVFPAWGLAGWAVQQLISLAAVCLYLRFAVRTAWPPALATASILLVCNALFSQVGALLTNIFWDATVFPGIDLLLLLVIHAGRFAAFVLLARKMGGTFASTGNRYLHLSLLPCALLNLLLTDSFYTLVGSLQAGGGDTALMTKAGCTVLLAAASFALTMYAFARAGQLAGLQTERRLLAQEVQNQKRYIQQAARREEENRGLAHDMKNHLLVLAGLLDAGDAPGAQDYLARLGTAAAQAAPAEYSGNPAVDTLLREKLAHAKRQGIATACEIQLPQSGGLDTFDVCVVLANALDNALHACEALPRGEGRITLEAKCRGQL